MLIVVWFVFFCFKQKTAYEMRISDWSSDVCSSDLDAHLLFGFATATEKTLFRELIKISGVGPKLALTVLSGVSVEDFWNTIRAGDVARLTKIGRASCRERVCQYVSISVVAVTLKKKIRQKTTII